MGSFFAACSSGKVDAIERLIGEGADIHAVNHQGMTGLHVAADSGCAKAVEYLLSQGADIEAKDAHGNTPLVLATLYGGKPCAMALACGGADLEPIRNGFPLTYAEAKALQVLQASERLKARVMPSADSDALGI